jgi:hypothetical protein
MKIIYLIAIVFIVVFPSISKENQSMMDNNYYHAGLLIVVPEDSTWADWNSSKFMFTQDSIGQVFPFIPPYLHKQKQTHVPKVKSNTQKWFSVLDPGDSPKTSEKERMVPESKEIKEILEDSTWNDEKELGSSSRVRKVRVIKEQDDGAGDDRIRPVQRVIPE